VVVVVLALVMVLVMVLVVVLLALMMRGFPKGFDVVGRLGIDSTIVTVTVLLQDGPHQLTALPVSQDAGQCVRCDELICLLAHHVSMEHNSVVLSVAGEGLNACISAQFAAVRAEARPPAAFQCQ
jgi:hypothetical protein